MLFFAQTLDAIDGKHARRTKRSSPLGQLMDHGCDSMDNFLYTIVIAQLFLFGDSVDEKRISPKKLGSVNTNLFNLKSTKNASKRIDPPILSKPNYFIKTGMSYNKNNNEVLSNNKKVVTNTVLLISKGSNFRGALSSVL